MNSHFIIIRFMFVKRSCFRSEITDKEQDLLSFFSSMFMILAFIHGCFSIVDLKMRIILLFHCKDKAKKNVLIYYSFYDHCCTQTNINKFYIKMRENSMKNDENRNNDSIQ